MVDLREAANYLNKFAAELPTSGTRSAPTRSTQWKKPNLPRWSREQVRERLLLPSPYFVRRGFSPVILDRLDVGHSARLRRSIVPLYDDRGEACNGYLERSEDPACQKCRSYHGYGDRCCEGREKCSFSVASESLTTSTTFTTPCGRNPPRYCCWRGRATCSGRSRRG